MRRSLVPVLLLLAACKDAPEEGGKSGVLPPDTAAPDGGLDSADILPIDTFAPDTATDEVPAVTLEIHHAGFFEQSPINGPYTAMTGSLDIVEYVDGSPAQPWCRARFALTGLTTDRACPSCETTYLVEFYLTAEGPLEDEAEDGLEVRGLADCFSPDLPADLERRAMGWSPSDQTIYLDYFDTGIWLPWYEASEDRDTLVIDHIETFGFNMPEEDE